MKIKLDDNHFLNSDQFCYWITAVVIPGEKSRKKKPYEVRVSGYVATFEQAVDSYIDGKVNGSAATSLTKLAKEIRTLKKTVRGWKPNGS